MSRYWERKAGNGPAVETEVPPLPFKGHTADQEHDAAQSGLLLPVPAVGYRAWAVTGNGYFRSDYSGELWPPDRPFQARCRYGCGRAPAPQDEHSDKDGVSFVVPACGIYAYADRAQLPPPGLAGHLVGRVLLGGRLFEHEKGFRAEYALVDAIYYRAGWPDLVLLGVRALAGRYGAQLEEWPEDPEDVWGLGP